MVGPRLNHLIGAYFHQDADLEGDSVEAIVRSAVRAEDAELVAGIRDDADALLARGVDEAQLADALDGLALDPHGSGSTYRGWLETVRRIAHEG